MKIRVQNTIFRGLDLNSSLYVILFVAIMYSGSTFIGDYVMQLVCLLALILFFAAKVKGMQRNAFINRREISVHMLMALIVVFLLYQLTFSYDGNTTLVFVLRFVVYAVLLWVVPSMDLSYRVIKAMKIYSYLVAFSILITTMINGSKSGGLVGDYQFSGMMMSISFIIFLIDYYSKKNRMDLFGVILTAVTLLTSGKRSFAALIALSYLVVFLIYHNKKNNAKFIKLTGVLLLGLLLALICIPEVRLLFIRIREYSGDKTYNGRLYYWTAAGQIFANHKLSGIGMGCFSAYFDQFFHRLGNLEAYDAHNVYIQLLAETGLIGEILFISLFLVCLIKTFMLLRKPTVQQDTRCKSVLTYSLLMQIWFVCYCMTGNPLYGANQSFFYFGAVAMMISAKRYLKEKSGDVIR